MKQITSLAEAEVKNFGIEIVDVRIKRADLPEANSQAIFGRMQTEREREARELGQKVLRWLKKFVQLLIRKLRL